MCRCQVYSGNGTRTGIRHAGDPLNLEDLPGRGSIAHVAERRAHANGPRSKARVDDPQNLIA